MFSLLKFRHYIFALQHESDAAFSNLSDIFIEKIKFLLKKISPSTYPFMIYLKIVFLNRCYIICNFQ